jgi:hypothetical protein
MLKSCPPNHHNRLFTKIYRTKHAKLWSPESEDTNSQTLTQTCTIRCIQAENTQGDGKMNLVKAEILFITIEGYTNLKA